MKKVEFALKKEFTMLLIMVSINLFVVSETRGEGNLKENATSSDRYIHHGTGNP